MSLQGLRYYRRGKQYSDLLSAFTINEGLYICTFKDALFRLLLEVLEEVALIGQPRFEGGIVNLKRVLEMCNIDREILDDLNALSIVVVQEATCAFRLSAEYEMVNNKMLTKLCILVLVPLMEVQVQKLQIMKL